MSQEIAIRTVTEEDMKTLEQAGIIPKNTPVSQLKVFAKFCQEIGLSPFTGEVHLVGYKNQKTGEMKYSRIVGIDGFRRKAGETGELAGTEPPRYNVTSDGSYQTASDLLIKKELPVTCTMTVWRFRNGQRVPFSAEVVFNEFAKRYNGVLAEKWKDMPFQMIAKVSEAFALRKGFPDRVAGLSIPEEAAAYEGTNEGPIAEDQDARKTAIEQITSDLTHVKDIKELQAVWTKYRPWQKDEEIIELVKAKGRELEEIQVETEAV
jgi:phage recombination protein Bet